MGEQRVDLALGADVDAARRLVDEDDGAVGVEAACDQTLLLIAAGQLLDERVDARRADIEPAHKIAGYASFELPAEQAGAADAAKPRQGDVESNRLRQEGAFGLAVLGQERHAAVDRRTRVAARNTGTTQLIALSLGRIGTDKGAEQLRAARPRKAADAQDLARTN